MDTLPRSLDELAKSLRDSYRNYNPSDGAIHHDGPSKKSHNINWKHYGIMLFLFAILTVSSKFIPIQCFIFFTIN